MVIATATTYLLNYGYTRKEGITYRKYYDTLTLTINGKSYEAIVLDSCGAAMSKNIIDIFVSGPSSSINTTIILK